MRGDIGGMCFCDCRFAVVCEEAYLALRRKGNLFITLFAMMLQTGEPAQTQHGLLDTGGRRPGSLSCGCIRPKGLSCCYAYCVLVGWAAVTE